MGPLLGPHLMALGPLSCVVAQEHLHPRKATVRILPEPGCRGPRSCSYHAPFEGTQLYGFRILSLTFGNHKKVWYQPKVVSTLQSTARVKDGH